MMEEWKAKLSYAPKGFIYVSTLNILSQNTLNPPFCLFYSKVCASTPFAFN